MRINCNRENFLAAFQIAATVAPTRSPKPILQNIKLHAGEQGTTLTATDMEIGIRVDVEGVDVESEGDAVFPVARFGSILRESSDEQLHIETDGQITVIKGQRSEFRLPGEDPAQFPDIQPFADDAYHEVPVALMKELIRRTLFATDEESSRYALGGVLLEMEADRIIAVGTDGRRLAKMEGPAKSVGEHATGDTATIVPSRSMQLIERALGEGEGEVRLAMHGNDIRISSPRATITSRLVEGRFPKWRDVLPKRPDAPRIELTIGPLYSALRQAAIVASEESRGIDFRFADGTLELNASTAEVGQSRVEMPIAYDAAPLTVTMDHRFVSDFLKVLSPEGVCALEIKDSEEAALLSTADGYEYVVMPLAKEQ